MACGTLGTWQVLANASRSSSAMRRSATVQAQSLSQKSMMFNTRNATKLHREGRTTKDVSLIVQARSSTMGAKTKKEAVVLQLDYRIPVILLGGAATLVYLDNLLAAAPVGLLGLLLLFQTTRVRFVFDSEALEVKIGDQLQESGENVFVGGKNRWKYSTFVNWEMWWPNFPILVYFKEIQTKPEGQVHFFPVIFNGKQLYDLMVERAGPSQNSGPK